MRDASRRARSNSERRITNEGKRVGAALVHFPARVRFVGRARMRAYSLSATDQRLSIERERLFEAAP